MAKRVAAKSSLVLTLVLAAGVVAESNWRLKLCVVLVAVAAAVLFSCHYYCYDSGRLGWTASTVWHYSKAVIATNMLGF